jgi:hypothetical protein
MINNPFVKLITISLDGFHPFERISLMDLNESWIGCTQIAGHRPSPQRNI